jgi:hypothetical protein
LAGEWISADKIDNRFAGTNHDLAFEGQLFRDRRAQKRLAYIFAHDKRADGANVGDVEFS